MEEEAELSDMRERVAEGGSSWEMIGRAPSTGIERQEVKVFGCLFGNSVGKASEEEREALWGGERGERPLREGVPREWGDCSMGEMGETEKAVHWRPVRSLGGCVGAGIEFGHQVIVSFLVGTSTDVRGFQSHNASASCQRPARARSWPLAPAAW